MRNQSPTKQGKQQHFPDKNVSVVIEPSELVKWGFTQDTPLQTSSNITCEHPIRLHLHYMA